MNRLLAEKCEDLYLVHEIFPVLEFILLPSESKEKFFKEKGCHVFRKTVLDEVGEVDN